jgi:hypothetical protein
MEEKHEFEIYIHGVPGGGEEESKRADNALASELPPLSSEDLEMAKKYSMSPEEWQRSSLALAYARQHLEERARVFGQRVTEILDGLGPGYRLARVARKDHWGLRIETVGDSIASVAVPNELVDDVLDLGAQQDVDRLKNLILFGVGRQELIFKH